ncbi:MAG TPA: N-acetylgalactosamine 6-sulfate sulfatase, partial [Planctomycetaceae bacterium]|nr:N-acetylgalactosamine 6-sulfate sulfatase [Planctomycetaceae bacterium]
MPRSMAGTLTSLLVALAGLSPVPTYRCVLAASRHPSVILIMTDDQGYGDLACHGNPQIKTPVMDRLYAQSVRLTNYHVDPTCSPTRSALMTGRYSTRTGVWHTIMGRSIMAPEEVTIAEVFAAAGYRTAIFGKWHLGDNYPCRPQDQGFHEVLIHGGGG